MNSNTREYVDELINHFWMNGYLTVSRKYGIYLPEPDPVGNYSIDAVAKYNKDYAFGIVLNGEELNDKRIISKLDYLATRHTKYSKKNVTLFIGVSPEIFANVKTLVESLSPDALKNIKIVILQNKSTAMKLFKPKGNKINHFS